MAHRLEIETLRTLKAIYEAGSITHAADKLALTQSAVSHKIRRFEQNIGCQLLNRQPGKSVLTEDGRQLVNYASKMIELHDEALSSINRPNLKGRIRLGVTEELVSHGLAKILGRFQRLHPEVNIKTQVEQSLVLNKKLINGQLDMIVIQCFSDEVQTQDTKLWQDELLWVASTDFSVPDQGLMPFIAFDNNCFYRQWALQSDIGKKLAVTLECASIHGVSSAVSAGMGIALLAKRHLKPDMLILEWPAPPAIAFIVRCNTSAESQEIKTLRKDIIASLGGGTL